MMDFIAIALSLITFIGEPTLMVVLIVLAIQHVRLANRRLKDYHIVQKFVEGQKNAG